MIGLRRGWAPTARFSSGSCPSRHPRSGASRRTTSSETLFETTAERKLRQRQLTEDGNIEISGRAWR
jgi:hypothetical protein